MLPMGLVLALLAMAPAAVVANEQMVAQICKSTPYPELCTATAGKQVGHYAASPVDALAVLNMQVDAFEKRTAAARARVGKVSAGVTPKAKEALDLCDNLYNDVIDALGAARRAIVFKDAVTIRAMMSMAAQAMQGCDEKFRQVGEKNPMTRFDQSLLNISENCRALSNKI